VAEQPLYLFDGHNILHAGRIRGQTELVDRLASFVSLRGARGIVVFDGVGKEAAVGPLRVRFASPADRLIERLAAEHRTSADVYVVSSDRAVRRTAGFDVRHLSAQDLLRELEGDTDHWRRY
jgi:predicted RNA-binding protein with PIN domain